MNVLLLFAAAAAVHLQLADAATCSINGDPHYRTFDVYLLSSYWRAINFQGPCTYILAASKAGIPGATFRILGENEQRNGNVGVSYIKAIIIEWNGYKIKLFKAGAHCWWQVLLWSIIGSGATLNCHSGNWMQFEAPGLKVRYNGQQMAYIDLDNTYFNSVYGLCGNFNGVPSDDYTKRDGTYPGGATTGDIDQAIGDSYRDTSYPCPGVPGILGVIRSIFGKRRKRQAANIDICDALKPNEEGDRKKRQAVGPNPFDECYELGSNFTQTFIENCVYDVMFACEDDEGRTGVKCEQMEGLAQNCFDMHGIRVLGWREYFDCPLTCPPGFVYTSNMPTPGCLRTCANPAGCLTLSGEAGCVCPDGKVLRGKECVTLNKCRCVDASGDLHKPGQTWLDPIDCKTKFTCEDDFSITEEEHACKEDEICSIIKGVGVCVKTACEIEVVSCPGDEGEPEEPEEPTV